MATSRMRNFVTTIYVIPLIIPISPLGLALWFILPMLIGIRLIEEKECVVMFNIVMLVFAAIMILFAVLVLTFFLQVDIKMTLRYRRGPKTKAKIINSLGTMKSFNYGLCQPGTKFYVYEVEYTVNGLHIDKIYDKKKREIGESVEVPYWIEKDGTQELTPKTYHDRFLRFLATAIGGAIIGIGCVIYIEVFGGKL